MNYLKSCPACHGQAEVIKEDPYDGDYVAICRRCGVRCPIRGRSEDEAADAWNRWIK